MIYRVLAALLLGMGTALFASAAIVADQIASIAHGRPATRSGVTGLVARLFGRRTALVTAALLFITAVAVSWPGVVEYVTTAHVHMHWSRVVLSSLLTVVSFTLVTTLYLTETIDLIRAQRSTHESLPAPDRLRPGR
jgi:hypothetical protein